MRKINFDGIIHRSVLLACLSLFIVLQAPVVVQADTKIETDKLVTILDKECVNLKKDKLKSLLLAKFSSDLEKGLSPELLKIIEGVIKRTDFDNISENKTAEIVGLVYESFRKGAPLEYLDQIFDVAYAKTISIDSLTAAAKALKDFHHSDVPQDVVEEFVYRSLEDGWDPASMPALARGLIYGVERGLTPQKVAMIIMLDINNGELSRKSPEQLVLDSISLVRSHEPKKWKAMKHAETELEKQRRDRVREGNRQKQLFDMGQSITTYTRTGRLDVEKLNLSVDQYIGVPYRYGGDSEIGIDCSAFTRRVYRFQNVELPRSSLEQSFVGFVVNEPVMRPGDLVFFDASITGRISHVGVYLGNGVFAHASSSNGVTKSSIREKYYMQRFVKAKRIFAL